MFRSPSRMLQVAPAIDVAHRGMFTIGSARCIAAPAGKYTFVSTESLAGRRNALRRLRDSFVILIPIALLVAGLGGYFLASRTLAPVARITEAASRIEAENLSERITVRNRDDELGRLAAVLNALLERLERSFQQQKQLLADTSHELRTPLTIIRSEADVTLSRERSAEEYRRALEVIQSESAHLTSLIESVLLLARADAQQARLARQEFALAEVIEQSIQSLRTIAQ